MGRPSEKRDKMFKPPTADSIGFQSRKLAAAYRKKRVNMLAEIQALQANLKYGPDTNKAEDAMCSLGELLGLDSSRPDASIGTGPDNLWCGEGEVEAWGFDLKTGKEPESEYTKSEIGQAHDHMNWLRSEKQGKKIKVSIVGRELIVSDRANPDPVLDVIELSGLQEIAENVEKLFQSVDAGDKSNLEDSFEGWLRHYGLTWPICVLALPSKRALDLKVK